MEFNGPRHKRSKSDFFRLRVHDDKNTVSQPPKAAMEHVKNFEEPAQMRVETAEVEISLKEEIEQLQKQLEDQLLIRSELEKATTSQGYVHDPINEDSLPKSAVDIIKEIASLEIEVKHMEMHLLSLYRKTFQTKEPSLFAADTKSRPREQPSSLFNSTKEPSLFAAISRPMEQPSSPREQPSSLFNSTKEPSFFAADTILRPRGQPSSLFNSPKEPSLFAADTISRPRGQPSSLFNSPKEPSLFAADTISRPRGQPSSLFNSPKEPSLFAADTISKPWEQPSSLFNSTASTPARASTDNPPKDFYQVLESQDNEDSSVNRCHSSLSCRTSALYESFHSLPLRMLEDDYSSVSRADHLGGSISNNLRISANRRSEDMVIGGSISNNLRISANRLSEDMVIGGSISNNLRISANRLSEDMIMCMTSIYGQIADPPLVSHEFPSSPLSFPSPPTDSSPRDQFSMWSPLCERSMEFGGPYFCTVEVQGICRSSQRLRSVEHKQRNYRALIFQLQEVDPRRLKHEEKLAFWINIHNALVMHAYLVHGTPRGALKRISLVLKAAYKIGGHTISAEYIQNTILGCRLPPPGHWLPSFLFSSSKYKSRDARKEYAMNHPQPLAYFALCAGSHSDPMVRIYTPKSIFQELEVAKEEYIHNNFKIQKGQKMVLPKLVDIFAKESGLGHSDLMDMVELSVPECHQKDFKFQKGKSTKKIEWAAHDFTFRYLLMPDLAK